MDIGLNAADVYSRVMEESSELSDAARSLSVLLFSLSVYHTHTCTLVFFSLVVPSLPIDLSIYLFSLSSVLSSIVCRLIGMRPLNRRSSV